MANRDGATEIALSQKLSEYADTLPDLDQYADCNLSKAFEVFSKALAENSGAGVNGTNLGIWYRF